MNGKLKPCIIDFGKACPIKKGKKYFISDTKKKVYKTEHPQVAPDVCDGRVVVSSESEKRIDHSNVSIP